ncbi:uncharacterized protein [Epargyreus clarus]|uniref:uncharacterized protein n=1 Tax=Epargyreus clarus TaxID=520877 RepID=UPI003C2D731A
MRSKNVIQPQFSQNILRLYKPVLILLLIFGFNFKVFKFKPIFINITKLYCFFLVLITSYSTLTCCFDQEILQVWPFIEYSSSVIILIFYDSKVTKFFENLSIIDTYLRINKRHYQSNKNKTFLYTTLLWLERCLYTGLYCISYSCYGELFYYLISQLSLLALDVNRVWRFILLDTVRYRLKLLRLRLGEMKRCDFYLYVKDRKTIKEDKMRFCLYLYKSIADVLDLITPELNASIFVSIICGVPKLIINIYHILLIIEDHEPVETVGFVIMQIVQVSFFLFSPSIVVELYSSEVEKIRLILMHELIDVKDASAKEDIQLFLQYTHIRAFQYRIWRCIPINIGLPIEIINLCTSYVIVIINFTHLYG